MSVPIKPVDFLILLVLVDDERHGYGMLREIESLTDGDLRLDAGNLYRSLKRLLDAGLIEASGRRPAPESDDERRRYYRLTPRGRETAAGEARRMDGLLRLGTAKKLLSESR